jgi:predicted homoserine dehydrogenase-like protein
VSYVRRLQERERATGRPVRIGLVGAGQMGLGFLAQVNRIPGMEVSAVADVLPGRAEAALLRTGRTAVADGSDVAVLSLAVEEGRAVTVDDAMLLTALPLDVIVDASGVPDVGAAVAFAALLAGQDVALLNVECDVTVGLLLSSVAAQCGRVYTVCRGDEPAEAKRLVDFARNLAFEVVCAGKGKNNPLNPYATPDSLRAEAERKHMNPKMLASFVDGSKAMIEMASLANATGLEVSRRGMYGPPATVPTLHDVFRPASDGGVLDRAGVVDYCTGPVAPGVFVVARSEEPLVVEEMAYLGMGDGPYYSFYRPYHLASIEAPLSVAETVLDRMPSLAPESWKAEVVAATKRPLRAGEKLDGIGGSTVYGVIEQAPVAKEQGFLPLGLLDGATLVRDLPVDATITAADVELRPGTAIGALRALQDRLSSRLAGPSSQLPSLDDLVISQLAAGGNHQAVLSREQHR